jgi:hypothetical protein
MQCFAGLYYRRIKRLEHPAAEGKMQKVWVGLIPKALVAITKTY